MPITTEKYGQYLKDRHEAYVDQRKRLDSNALSVAEKYDQWILTVAGGALVFSLTFLEKIAASPLSWSIPFVLLAWFCFVTSLLAGFLAIHFSTKGVIRQIELLDAEYKHFRATSTRLSPEGEIRRATQSKYPKLIRRCSEISLAALISGSVFLCIFASINLLSKRSEERPQKIEVLFPQKKEQQERQVMDDDKEFIQGSYVPPKNEEPPPTPLIETYIPPTNEVPPPPPPSDD